MGNDPTGRNHGRAAGGGDPATNAGSILEHGRGRDDVEREDTNGYGELELPLPVLIPTRSNRRGSIAYHAVVPLGRKYRTEAVVPLTQAAVKNYCRVGR